MKKHLNNFLKRSEFEKKFLIKQSTSVDKNSSILHLDAFKMIYQNLDNFHNMMKVSQL